jgi:hypothetical protein
VSNGARLVFDGVRSSVRIGEDMRFCFRLFLIGVNPESTDDCLGSVSGISSGIGLTVLPDDLRPEELGCFLCFQDDLYFLVSRWVFSYRPHLCHASASYWEVYLCSWSYQKCSEWCLESDNVNVSLW